MDDRSTAIVAWLSQLRDGDPAARDRLIAFACERFSALAHRMLRGDYARVGRWAATDDVMQGALLRLVRALKSCQPADALAFRRLVTLQLRRELIDLARKHFGPQGIGRNHGSAAGFANYSAEHIAMEKSCPPSEDPRILSDWTEFHETIGELPERLRDVFELRHYHEMPVREVAETMGISDSTVGLRYAEAVALLRRRLRGMLPDQ